MVSNAGTLKLGIFKTNKQTKKREGGFQPTEQGDERVGEGAGGFKNAHPFFPPVTALGQTGRAFGLTGLHRSSSLGLGSTSLPGGEISHRSRGGCAMGRASAPTEGRGRLRQTVGAQPSSCRKPFPDSQQLCGTPGLNRKRLLTFQEALWSSTERGAAPP